MGTAPAYSLDITMTPARDALDGLLMKASAMLNRGLCKDPLAENIFFTCLPLLLQPGQSQGNPAMQAAAYVGQHIPNQAPRLVLKFMIAQLVRWREAVGG